MVDTTANDGSTAPIAKTARLSNDEELTLLTLGDPLGSILKHCDVVSVCRIERTCRTLKNNALVRAHWDHLDLSVPEKRRSELGPPGKHRFARFYSAEVFAAQMEPLLKDHMRLLPSKSTTKSPTCEESCCVFPDKLCTDLFDNADHYEVFIRFSKQRANGLSPDASGGFVGIAHPESRTYGTFGGGECVIDSFVLSLANCTWPGLAQALDASTIEQRHLFYDEVKNLVVTIVSVHRQTAEVGLISGGFGFWTFEDDLEDLSYLPPIRSSGNMPECHGIQHDKVKTCVAFGSPSDPPYQYSDECWTLKVIRYKDE